MDDAALRRTVRRCTAVLVAVFAPALGPISNYAYNGRFPLLLAVGYLLVSLAVQFIDVGSEDLKSADSEAATGDGPGGNEGETGGADSSDVDAVE